MMNAWHNTIGRAIRRPSPPLNAERQFESTSCAPPFPSAALTQALAQPYQP